MFALVERWGESGTDGLVSLRAMYPEVDGGGFHVTVAWVHTMNMAFP